MFLTAQALKPFWGATLIDGYEGMEGNGPGSGTPVFGAVFTYGIGFAGADVLHNAAHDARHANNFPCH